MILLRYIRILGLGIIFVMMRRNRYIICSRVYLPFVRNFDSVSIPHKMCQITISSTFQPDVKKSSRPYGMNKSDLLN